MNDKANRHRVAAATAIALGSFLITATPAIALEDPSAPVSTGTITTQAIYAGTSDGSTESVITSEGSVATTSSTSQASDFDSAKKNFSAVSASDAGDNTTPTPSARVATTSNVDTKSTTTGDASYDSADSNLAHADESEPAQLDSNDASDSASNVQPTVNAVAAEATCQEDATESSRSGSSEAASNDAGQVSTSKPQGKLHVRTQAHVEGTGWQGITQEGDVAGTTGQSKRLEGVRIELRDNEGNPIKGVSYKAHVENIGWQSWVHDGELAGTTGKSLRLEALRVKLSEELAASYSLWYRVHVKDLGWLAWTNDGGVSGTINMGLRVEAVQFELLSKANITPDSSEPETKRPARSAAGTNSGKTCLRIAALQIKRTRRSIAPTRRIP